MLALPWLRTSFAFLCVGTLCACQTKAPYQYAPLQAELPSGSVLVQETSDTIQQEHNDRINRLLRISAQVGAPIPTFTDNLVLPPGEVAGINNSTPVTRISYADTGVVFFDTNKAEIRAEAMPVIDALAEVIKKDLPDTQVMVLGHTDSTGSDALNSSLSERRAMTVMRELAHRGVGVAQLSTVGIGARIPVADNATIEGRAKNRRVEFLISRYEAANIRFIETAKFDPDWVKRQGPFAESVPVTSDGLNAQPVVAPGTATVAVLNEAKQPEYLVVKKIDPVWVQKQTVVPQWVSKKSEVKPAWVGAGQSATSVKPQPVLMQPKNASGL